MYQYVILCLICLVLYFLRLKLQQVLLFTPLKGGYKKPTDIRFEEFTTITTDNTKLYGIIFKYNDSDKYLLYSHGNTSNIYERYDKIKNLAELFKINVIAYDYRGYGLSNGIPSTNGLYIDIMAIWEHLFKLNIQSDNVILYGESLGCPPTLYLGTHITGFKSIILVAGFSSLRNIVWDLHPYLIFMVFGEFDNMKMIKQLDKNIPVYIIHSKTDEVAYYHHAHKLLAHGNHLNYCKLLTIRGKHSEQIYTDEQIEILQNIF